MKLLKKSSRLLFMSALALGLTTSLFANDIQLESLIGSVGLSAFDEMRNLFLDAFCKYDNDFNNVPVDSPCPSFGPGSRYVLLGIPGKKLKDGFFAEFEKKALDEKDFADELAKTPRGQQLLSLYLAQNKDIKFKLFYHVDSSETSLSEKLKTQMQEHVGFSVAQNNKAIIGINAYQNQTEAFYTRVHELYHLFDPYSEKNKSKLERELRAFLFELRVYLERQVIVPHAKYTQSQFHESFIIRVPGGFKLDWVKLSSYIDEQTLPLNAQNNLQLAVSIGREYLNFSSENSIGEVNRSLPGLDIDDALLGSLEKELNKPEQEQNENTIVVRLIYKPATPEYYKDHLKYKKFQERLLRNGVAQQYSQTYGHFMDQQIRFKPNGINDINSGCPRPRDEGGSREGGGGS